MAVGGGGDAGIDEEETILPRSWPGLLMGGDPGGAYSQVAGVTRLYYWGQDLAAAYTDGFSGSSSHGITTSSGYNLGLSGDFAFCLPQFFPIAGTIKRVSLVVWRTGMRTFGRAQLCIYSSARATVAGVANGAHYPDELLANTVIFSGLDLFNGQALQIGSNTQLHVADTLIDLHVDAGTLLWGVMRFNQDMYGGIRAMWPGQFPLWIGHTLGDAGGGVDNGSAGFGWYHADPEPWTTPPNPFHQSNPQVMGGYGAGHLPQTFGFGFAAD